MKPVNLEVLSNLPTDDHSLPILKPVDLSPALIVGFWVPINDDFCDDPGIILELYDGTCKAGFEIVIWRMIGGFYKETIR